MLPYLVILFCIRSFIVTNSLYKLIAFKLHKMAPCWFFTPCRSFARRWPFNHLRNKSNHFSYTFLIRLPSPSSPSTFSFYTSPSQLRSSVLIHSSFKESRRGDSNPRPLAPCISRLTYPLDHDAPRERNSFRSVKMLSRSPHQWKMFTNKNKILYFAELSV